MSAKTGQPNEDRCGQEGSGVKITTNLWTSFMDSPKTRCLTIGFKDIQDYLENPASVEPTLEEEILHSKP